MMNHCELSADIRCRCGERFQDTSAFEQHTGRPSPDVTWLEHSNVLTAANHIAVLRVHSADNCLSKDRCPIHNRSDHAMRTFPQLWRTDISVMERTCEHGIGHPDPDSSWDKDDERWSHGCDGCCSPTLSPVLALTASPSRHHVTSVSWSKEGRAYVSCSCGALMSGDDPHLIWELHVGMEDE